jgi:hypothetical protein
MTLQNLSETEARALASLFRYYSNKNDARQSASTQSASTQSSKVKSPDIFLAQMYSIITELGEHDGEKARMKKATQQLNSASIESNKDSTIPLGCLSLNQFLHIVDQGRERVDNDNSFHLIRIIADYEQRAEYEGEYLLAKELLDQHKALQREEENKQLAIIKKKHIDDKRKLVIAHDEQLVEFMTSWDQFMKEFEQKSQAYLEELAETHKQQLSALREEVVEEVKSKPQRWSKELVDWRKREAIMADQQKYQEAQRIKTISDALESKERANKNSKLESSLRLKEGNLKKQHAAEVSALQQRIDTKRREFDHQRKGDEARMIQRNRNILAMVDSKQAAECTDALKTIEQTIKNKTDKST